MGLGVSVFHRRHIIVTLHVTVETRGGRRPSTVPSLVLKSRWATPRRGSFSVAKPSSEVGNKFMGVACQRAHPAHGPRQNSHLPGPLPCDASVGGSFGLSAFVARERLCLHRLSRHPGAANWGAHPSADCLPHPAVNPKLFLPRGRPEVPSPPRKPLLFSIRKAIFQAFAAPRQHPRMVEPTAWSVYLPKRLGITDRGQACWAILSLGTTRGALRWEVLSFSI